MAGGFSRSWMVDRGYPGPGGLPCCEIKRIFTAFMRPACLGVDREVRSDRGTSSRCRETRIAWAGLPEGPSKVRLTPMLFIRQSLRDRGNQRRVRNVFLMRLSEGAIHRIGKGDKCCETCDL